MPKKITIISATFPPEKGAAPSRIYGLASLLVKNGYKVSVVCFMPNYPTGHIFPSYKGKLTCTEKIDGIDVYRVWSYPSNSKNIFARIYSLFTQALGLFVLALPELLQDKSELVIINSPPLLTAYAGSVIAKWKSKKILLNVSDIWPLSALELGVIKKGSFYSLMEWMEKQVYGKANAYLCQSNEIANHIQAQPPNNKNCFLYYNLQEEVKLTATTKANVKRKIVYAGLLGVAQGVYAICKTINFAALGTELHIYGDGNEKEMLTGFINANPSKGIYYHDPISADKVPEMLRDFDATLVPLTVNIQGALPSKVFMAAANGIPVFFSGNGEGAKIVREHKIGWVNAAGDLAALQKNIEAFVQMRNEELETIKSNCTTLSATVFNKQRQDERFIHFLRSL